ncbi:MAG: TIGR04442 family protein [Proteobacteria bacterium]|nr:TIGR04442 family protein [Pseudomonadota bacterium]
MLNKIMFEGQINQRLRYTFYAFGNDVYEKVFYSYNKDENIERFFAKGCGFTLTNSGLIYKGFGGSFCSYMFGVERPFKDLIKLEVKNRLVMFGAKQKNENIIEFTDDISGEESYINIFSEGNAITNYFFLVVSNREFKTYGKRQEEILRKLGKALKRTNLVSTEKDEHIVNLLYEQMGEKDAIVMLLKLYDVLVKELWYLLSKVELKEEEEKRIKLLESKIESYQLERIKVESAYHREENQKLVNDYVSILIKRYQSGYIDDEDEARLKKIRLVLIRNGIPASILDNLERVFVKPERETGDKDVRDILMRLLETGNIDTEGLVKLLIAKKESLKVRDMTFEQFFLDVGRMVDEKASKEENFLVVESFNTIITYFDRFDTTHQLITKIAFVPESTINESHIRSLVGNYRAFEDLRKGFFNQLFLNDIYKDPYLTFFGRKRLEFLEKQIPLIAMDEGMLLPSVFALKSLMQDEVYFYKIIKIIKDEFWEVFSLWGEKDMDMEYYTAKVTEKLANEVGGDVYISKHLWQEIFWHIKKEVFLITQVLPKMIEEGKKELKEDFILNSGMDRFYVEEVERAYLAKHGVK